MPKVTSAAAPPSSSCRSPDRTGERPFSTPHSRPNPQQDSCRENNHGDQRRRAAEEVGQDHHERADRECQQARDRGGQR